MISNIYNILYGIIKIRIIAKNQSYNWLAKIIEQK